MKIAYTSVLLLFLTACSAGKLEVRKYVPGTTSEGILYSLPRTLIQVTLPYTIMLSQSGDGNIIADAALGTTLVSTRQFPDPQETYEIRTDLANSFTWQNEFEADLTEEGYLTKADVAFQDNSLSALKGFVNLALPFAPVPRSLLEKSSEMERLQGQRAKNSARLLELYDRSSNADVAPSEVKALKDQIALILGNQEAIEARIEALEQRTESEITITCTINPEPGKLDYEINEANCPSLQQFISEIKGETNGTLPRGFVERFHLQLEGDLPLSREFPSAESDAYYYRIPFRGSYTLRTKDPAGAFLSEGQVNVSQLGTLGRIHVRSSRFAKKSVSVSLHPATGGLKSYSANSEGAGAENLVSNASDISAAVRDALRQPTELEALKAEISLLNAKIDKIKKERELKELQSDQQ